MSLRHSPTIDELLGDSLVQAVMRADNVEPQALRTLLTDTAFRVTAARAGPRPAGRRLAGPPIDGRAASRGANAPARVRPAPPADPCGSALCC
jgi:hypothetical protein